MPNIWLNANTPIGECTICGRDSRLTAKCRRCGKWSCGKEFCLRLIKEPGQCAVPMKGERDDTGDRLAAGQWLD